MLNKVLRNPRQPLILQLDKQAQTSQQWQKKQKKHRKQQNNPQKYRYKRVFCGFMLIWFVAGGTLAAVIE